MPATEQPVIHALTDEEAFQRLIKDIVDLRETAKQFPGHASILGKATREER